MPAKGSCCCNIIRAGTMWKINVHTGETVVSLDYSHAGTPISTKCGLDGTEAFEGGQLSGARLWTTSGSLQWGPVAHNDPTFRGWAHFLDYYDYIVYGGQGIGGDALEVLDRNDGSAVAHSMVGWFLKAEEDYIDTFDSGDIARYEASDLSTVRDTATVGSTNGVPHPTSAIYALRATNTVTAFDPSDLSTLFSFTAPFTVDSHLSDAEGGAYVFNNAANRIARYTGSSADWDEVNASYPTPTFGAFGNLYARRSSPSRLMKIDGTDGSIAWETDFSAYVPTTLTTVLQARQFIGHSGVLLLPCGPDGLVAIDDDSGYVIWHSENKGYGRPIPDGDNHVWVCGEYGL